MRRSLTLALFLFGSSALSLAGTQPDRTAALEKAKTKFETDIAKVEEALLKDIDKALKAAQATKNKQLTEKLTYEREQFVKHRLVPTAVPTAAYVRQRAQAIAALEAAYAPAIKELAKAKKDEEVEALETALNDLVKASRGYGLALSDLEARPVFVIENKATGLVVEPENKDGTGNLVLGPKVGKKKPSQCWQLEREEEKYVIRNVANRWGFHVTFARDNPGELLIAWPPEEQAKQTNKGSLFRIGDGRREVVLGLASNELALTATEKKQKGVTIYYVTQEKKEEKPTDKQRWVLTEAK